ncbi:MAG: hypothetical protein JXA90_10415, partial [Planctomycetes bacterium]|nr:hypothetical protein [Planctomycetota bacterium]
APDLPAGLERVVGRALAKDPQRRYPDMAAFLADLVSIRQGRAPSPVLAPRPRRWVLPVAAAVMLALAVVFWRDIGGLFRSRPAAPSAAGIGCIGVLPLTNLSGDEGQEYFSLGITNAILGRLARIGALRVISFTRHDEVGLPFETLVDEMGVDALLEGSVLRREGEIVISVMLLRKDTREPIFSRDFSGEMSDILSINNEIARTVADEAAIELSPEERHQLGPAGRVNPEVYDLCLKGQQGILTWGRENWEEAIAHFRSATQKAPSYAPAWAGLAYVYAYMARFVSFDDYYPVAVSAAERALQFDDELAEAHSTMGILLWFDFRWEEAERELLRGIELNERSYRVWEQYSDYLMMAGRFREGIAAARRAEAVDPLGPGSEWFLIWCYMAAYCHDEALAEIAKKERLFPDYGRFDLYRTWVHWPAGEHEQALAVHDRAGLPLEPERWARLGRRDEALASIDSLAAVDPWETAKVYALLGEQERAMDFVEKTAAEHSGWFLELNVAMGDWLADLRDHPRLVALRERYHFPDIEPGDPCP